MVSDVRDDIRRKASEAIVVTELGMVRDVRDDIP